MYFFFKRDLRFVLAPKANIKYLPSTAFVISFSFPVVNRPLLLSLIVRKRCLLICLLRFTRLCEGRLLNWKLVNFLARESLPKLFPLEKSSPCTVIGADLAVDSFCRGK